MAERVSFARGDAQKLDFPDGTFDAVTSNYVYHNIQSPDRQAILLETLRVLKKGGTFAIHDIFSKEKYGDMHAAPICTGPGGEHQRQHAEDHRHRCHQYGTQAHLGGEECALHQRHSRLSALRGIFR